MLRRTREQGDTLIEVMLAVVILSAVAVGVSSIMNKGMTISLTALERTEVRSKVSQQIEVITYIRDRYSDSLASGTGTTAYPASLWGSIKSRAPNSSSATTAKPTDCTPSPGSFFVRQNADTETYDIVSYTASSPATLPSPGDGIWVEPVASTATSVSYIDFYVKACWSSLLGAQQETISSTVRLYDNNL